MSSTEVIIKVDEIERSFKVSDELAMHVLEIIEIAYSDPSRPIEGLAQRNHPETSKKATRTNLIRRGNQRTKLLECYLNGDLTDEQVGILTGLNGRHSSSTSSRCAELRQHGYIEDTGMTRKTESGCDAVVCRITPAGRMAMEKVLQDAK